VVVGESRSVFDLRRPGVQFAAAAGVRRVDVGMAVGAAGVEAAACDLGSRGLLTPHRGALVQADTTPCRFPHRPALALTTR
jgi:hypothetical protein